MADTGISKLNLATCREKQKLCVFNDSLEFKFPHFFLQDACLMRLLCTTKMCLYRICCLKAASSYALWRNTTWYTVLAAMHKNNSVWCPKAFPKLEKDVAPQRLTPLLKHLSSLWYSNYGTNSSSAWFAWICTSYRFSLLSFQIAADGEVPTPEAVDRILKGIS